MRTHLLLSALLLAAPLSFAFEKNDTARYASLMTGIVNIPPGDPIASDAPRDYKLSAPRASGRRTLLLVEIRIDNEAYGGCNYGVAITVNGHDLGEQIDRMNRRLLGKSAVAHVQNYPGGAAGPWKRYGWWLLMYAPDFADKQIEEGDDCIFLWDVTDLLAANGQDVIRVESTTKRLEEQVGRKLPLVIGRLEMGLVDDKALQQALPAPLPVAPVVPGTRLEGKGFSCWTAPGGGLAVKIGTEYFPIRSRFSYPAEPEGGWNHLEPGSSTGGETGWKPTISRKPDGSVCVSAAGKRYALQRTVRLAGHRVLVRDTFRNVTDSIIGLQIVNEVDCTGRRIAEVAIAADNDPNISLDAAAGDNPTLFMRPARAGLGLLAEDDVLRTQCEIGFGYPLGFLADRHFGLAPKASYTLEWTLYPTPSGDTWDFINQVRRDWDVNFTCPAGSFWCDCSSLTRMSDEDLRQYVEWSGGRWIMATPWLDCPPLPTRPTYEQIAATERETLAKLQRATPGTKLLLGTHPTMNFAIPGQGYDSDDYRDSWILDENGKHFWSKTYTDYFCVGIAKEQGFLNFCNFMTPGNSYWRKMIMEADVALDQAKSDGIYCDEFNHYNCVSPRTYGHWDGHWADLDPTTFAVKTDKQLAQLALVTDEAQEQYARYIMGKGGLFLANAQPVTRRMQKLYFPRFVETVNPRRGFHSALFSPLAYGNTPPNDEFAFFQFVRDRVNCCVLPHIGGMPKLTRPCVTARLFPFTPVDIRPGVMTGQERIIVTKSGRFGWKPPFKARLYVYDEQGVLAEAEPAVKTYNAHVQVPVPERGMAVLERVGTL